MTAVTVGRSGVAGRRLARARGAALPAAAGAARAVVRWAAATALAVRGLVGLLLISFGAWLAYEPAGFIVAGALLLADRVADGWPTGEREAP